MFFPQWDSVEKAGYQCCMGTMLHGNIAAQARQLEQSCPGKTFSDTDITRVNQTLAVQATSHVADLTMADLTIATPAVRLFTWV